MKAPIKIYTEVNIFENLAIVTFERTSQFPQSSDSVEYIHKNTLLEWAIMNRDKLEALSDNDAVRCGQYNAFQQMIDKLNSM